MRYLLALILCMGTLHAQELLDEVIVSDSRISKPRKNSGKSVIHITAIEIEQNKGLSLAQLLNQYAGIYISGAQQHPGQNLSYFIRGGNNRQVLVRIDGVVVSDPSQIESDFDLRLLALEQIASIEVVKGASSSLYGSGAATAIIDITTKQNISGISTLTVSQEFGTQNVQDQSIRSLSNWEKQFIEAQHQIDNIGLSASIQRLRSDGMSSVVGTESDAVEKENIQFSAKSQYNSPWAWSAFFHQDRFDANFDSTYPSFADADYSFLSKQQRFGFAPSFSKGKSSIQAQVSWSNNSRSYADSYPSIYAADIFTTELSWRYLASEKLTILSGVFYQDIGSDFKNDYSAEAYIHHNLAVFASANWQHSKGYALQLSARNSSHSEFGAHQTFTINPFYVFSLQSANYLKLFGSWATSFIAPSQYKMFSALYGNNMLTPEENQTFELGVEHVSEKNRFTLVAFQREEENFIEFVSLPNFAGQYRNSPTFYKVRGLEVEAKYNFDNWTINTNYTYTEKVKQAPLRLPKHAANFGVRYALPKAQWSLHWRYVGARQDFNQSFVKEKLNSYTLVDARMSFPNIFKIASASIAITNLFDTSYTEIFGFSTLGRNLTLALRGSF